jgi:hypothetical protein
MTTLKERRTNPSQTGTKAMLLLFGSHHRQIELSELRRQVRENYYLERRSIW